MFYDREVCSVVSHPCEGPAVVWCLFLFTHAKGVPIHADSPPSSLRSFLLTSLITFFHPSSFPLPFFLHSHAAGTGGRPPWELEGGGGGLASKGFGVGYGGPDLQNIHMHPYVSVTHP